MRKASSRRGLLALLVLTIVLALLAPMGSEAIFHKLFKGPDSKVNEATESVPSADVSPPANGAADYDSDSDSEDEREYRGAASPAGPAGGGAPGRGGAREPPATRVQLAARAKERRQAKSGAQPEAGHAHGRTRRNQLRQEGKPASSYLDDDDDAADWHNDNGVEDRRIKNNRARGRPRGETADDARRPTGALRRGDKDGKRPAKLTRGASELGGGGGGEVHAEADDDYDEDDFNYDQPDNQAADSRDTLAKAKYVSTGRTKPANNNKAAREELLSRISLARPAAQRGGANQAEGKRKKKSNSNGGQAGANLISKEFWQKGLTSVAKATNKGLKATNKGLKATKKALVELPKDLSSMFDKVSIMEKKAMKAAKLVRSEFSKFTIEWARIMEEALDYLGDTNLDKVVWDEADELDLRKDALHSLVIGYEFIRLMIIWRENMLLAHEGFRVWLEKAKLECEQDKSLDIMTDFGSTPDEVYNYMQLMAWDFIKYDGLEAQLNLDYMMVLEDSRPKDYMSRFFRNIIVLQEIYFPTMRALEEERKAVRLPSEDLAETYDFFIEFRQMVAQHLFDDVDIEAPKELAEFVAKMTPQLRLNRLVYSKSHVKSLAAKMEQAKYNRQRGFASVSDAESEYDED